MSACLFTGKTRLSPVCPRIEAPRLTALMDLPQSTGKTFSGPGKCEKVLMGRGKESGRKCPHEEEKMSELTVPEKESRRKYSYERKKVRENDLMRKKISEEKC